MTEPDHVDVNDQRAPYIHTQKVYLFQTTTTSPKSVLANSELLKEPHESPTSFDWQTIGGSPNSHPTDELFKKIFVDGGGQRLCIVNEAGMGKSIALGRARYFLSRNFTGHLVVMLEMRDIEQVADKESKGLSIINSIRIKFLNELKTAGVDSGFVHMNVDRQRAYIARQCYDGNVIVLFDGLDHNDITSDPEKVPVIQNIRSFLGEFGQQMKVVFSGRPFAVGRFWDQLRIPDSCPIAQMAYFDDEDQKRFLSPDCYDRLRQLDMEFLRIPRALSTIRELYFEDQRRGGNAANGNVSFEKLRNSADVYRESVQALLKPGLEDRMDLGKGARIFSVIAFQMLVDECDGVTSYDLEHGYLKSRVYDNHESELKHMFPSYEAFETSVLNLQRCNEGWEHTFLEKVGFNDGIYWRDKTLRDFFAACWLLRNETEKNWKLLWDLTFTGDEVTSLTSPWYWVWRFLFEADVQIRSGWTAPNLMVWLDIVERLFDIAGDPDKGQHGVEFVYRSWPHLCSLATQRRNASAKSILSKFQSRFARQLGESSVAREFLQRFESPPIESDIAVRSFPVTNAEYRLFFPGHVFDASQSSCPAANINFFEAAVFCSWASNEFLMEEPVSNAFGRYRCALPTHDQWALVCLSEDEDAATRFDGNVARMQNFYRRCGYCFGGGSSCYRKFTDAVANAWGYLDMHGNVWEWVVDHGENDKACRRAYGGSWRSDEITDFSAKGPGEELGSHVRRDDLGFRPVLVSLNETV